MKQKDQWIMVYEVVMFLLIFSSIMLVWSDVPGAYVFDRIVWGFLVLEYCVRLYKAKNKIEFIKSNVIDLIVLIPLDEIFMSARFIKVLRLIRLIYFGQRYGKTIYEHLIKANELQKALSVAVILIFLSSILITYFEPHIDDYEDALWWAIVTLTTVGYGDISPQTPVGRFIAIILMFFGIGIIGLITGSVASYFISNDDKKKDSDIEFVKSQLNRFDELSDRDFDQLIRILQQKRNNLLMK